MALPSICTVCESTPNRFSSTKRYEMKRHVAIVHGNEIFSTMSCGKCNRKFFDFDHFNEHLEISLNCRLGQYKMKSEPLAPHLIQSFESLVSQMMRVVEDDTLSTASSTGQIQQNINSDGGGPSGTAVIMASQIVSPVSNDAIVSSTTQLRSEEEQAKGNEGNTDRDVSILSVLKKPFRFCRGTQMINAHQAVNWNGTVRAASGNNFKRTLTSSNGKLLKRLGDMEIEEINPAPADSTSVLDQSVSKNNSRSRGKYCYQLIKKYSIGNVIQCQLCSDRIVVIPDNGNTRNCTMAMQHAMMHLNKPLFQCTHCQETKSNLDTILQHIQSYHAEVANVFGVPNYGDHTEEYHKDILEILRQCYDALGKGYPQRRKTILPNGMFYYVCRSALWNVRRQYFGSLVKAYSKNRELICKLCARPCRLKTFEVTIDHALNHLGIRIYRCKLCSATTKSHNQMAAHISISHRGKPFRQACIDDSDRYHKEIMGILQQCFDYGSQKGEVEPRKNALVGQSSIAIGEEPSCSGVSTYRSGMGEIPAWDVIGTVNKTKTLFQCKQRMLLVKHRKEFHKH